MRILQLCNKPPMPAVDGGCKAMLQSIDVLQHAGHTVDVFCISTNKHPYLESEIPTSFAASVNLQHVFINTDLSLFKMIGSINSSAPYLVQRFFSRKAEERIREILQKNQYDIILFESIYMCEYLPVVQMHTKAKVILRSHNVEHQLWESRKQELKNPFKKMYVDSLVSSLKKYETGCFNHIKNIISISSDDAHVIQKLSPSANIFNLPFLVNSSASQAQNTFPSFYHLGAMDWQPNIDSVKFILSEIVPSLAKKRNDFIFHFGGRNMSEQFLKNKLPGVYAHSNIPDATAFIAHHDVLIAPVFSGGGMRIKMIEALQMGKVIITTRLGASGIPSSYLNEECMLLAENKEEFIQQITRCLDNLSLRQNISAHALRMVQHEFQFDTKSLELSQYLKKLV